MTKNQAQLAGLAPTKAFVNYLRTASTWVKMNAEQVLIVTLFGFASGWVINFVLMAFIYDGWRGDDAMVTTGQDNVRNGMLIWWLFSSAVFGLISYWRAAGTKQLLREIVNFPLTIVQLFRQDRRSVWTHVLWGAASSLIASYFISQWLGLAVAVLMVSASFSTIGYILVSMIVQFWHAIMRTLNPRKAHRARGLAGIFVGLFTSAFVLLLSFFISNTDEKAVLGLLCVISALFITWHQRDSKAALILLFAFTFATLTYPYPAFADDGGFKEAGGDWWQWLRSTGLGDIASYALYGGFASAFGSILGWITGNTNSQIAPQLQRALPVVEPEGSVESGTVGAVVTGQASSTPLQDTRGRMLNEGMFPILSQSNYNDPDLYINTQWALAPDLKADSSDSGLKRYQVTCLATVYAMIEKARGHTDYRIGQPGTWSDTEGAIAPAGIGVQVPADFQKIVEQINSGNPVILRGSSDKLPYGQHFMLAVGVSESGSLIVIDPYKGQKIEISSTLTGASSAGSFTIASMKVVAF